MTDAVVPDLDKTELLILKHTLGLYVVTRGSTNDVIVQNLVSRGYMARIPGADTDERKVYYVTAIGKIAVGWKDEPLLCHPRFT